MEYTPEMQEASRLSYEDAREAKTAFLHGLSKEGYDGLGVSAGIGGAEDGYKVCIRVPDEELVVFAEMAASLYIPNTPIEIETVGQIAAE